MLKTLPSRYLKGVVSALGLVATVLETAYPAEKWSMAVTASIATLLVVLVPNAPPEPKPVAAK